MQDENRGDQVVPSVPSAHSAQAGATLESYSQRMEASPRPCREGGSDTGFPLCVFRGNTLLKSVYFRFTRTYSGLPVKERPVLRTDLEKSNLASE